ncbi:MAG: hypothetical protein P1P89_07300 [Desulfobacterales bacterium]|nr:hypothetical protein [Desulfobacterales bacterium]
MKQKYIIRKDIEKNELTIQEFAFLDKELKGREFINISKESFSLLCKETYDGKKMRSAIKQGKDTLVSELRTENMFPIGLYVDKIAESVMELYGSKNSDSFELLFDDKEFLGINKLVSDS